MNARAGTVELGPESREHQRMMPAKKFSQSSAEASMQMSPVKYTSFKTE